MNPELLRALAEVLDAGAAKCRQWVLNNDRQQDADVLQAMGNKARELADLWEES